MKRNKTQRMAIEQVFKRHKRPLGVNEVLAYRRKLVETLNQATVYRNLKILIDDPLHWPQILKVKVIFYPG